MPRESGGLTTLGKCYEVRRFTNKGGKPNGKPPGELREGEMVRPGKASNTIGLPAHTNKQAAKKLR